MEQVIEVFKCQVLWKKVSDIIALLCSKSCKEYPEDWEHPDNSQNSKNNVSYIDLCNLHDKYKAAVRTDNS